MAATPASSDQLRQELDHLKGVFLASLNHEIRTPLSGMLGMVDLLLETELDEEQREYASAARLCADNLLHILTATLEYSALEAGQLTLDQAEFSRKDLLDSVLDSQITKARAKGLRFSTTVDSSLPETLVGDAARIRQILDHLLDNAIKFTHDGSVELHLWFQPLTEQNDEHGHGVLTASVRDTGIGIPAEGRDRIFESFRQLDSGLARSYAGLGLGLALVQKIVGVMGGSIEVDSFPGVGSTFTVHLPVRLSDVTHPKKLRFAPGVITILAVDDNPVGVAVLRRALERLGLEADVAGDGETALESARRTLYDLILMDLQMPGMDGLETTAAIRQLPGYEKVPILAVTADLSDETRRRCYEAGMQEFLSKPVEASALWQAIQRAIKPVPAAPTR